MYEDLKSILIDISDVLLSLNFKNNYSEELHEEIRELVEEIKNFKVIKKNDNECYCDSNNLKLSDEALALLKALPDKYVYIAKNDDGDVDNLHIFVNHPHLISSADVNDNDCEHWQYWSLNARHLVASLSLFSYLFEDLDPNVCYKISDLLKR